MGQTIEISEKSAALLAQQAAAHGKSLEAWIEVLALEKAQTGVRMRDDRAPSGVQKHGASRSLVEQMREFRSHVKPDPEGWTVKDYINYGRR
jgi:hypothetical protein